MLGIIGGTGLYALEGLQVTHEEHVNTPYGHPSAPLVRGVFDQQEVIFLPRHGRFHEHLPHEVNYRANIYALKSLGVTQVIGVSAVGSLQEEIKPGDLCIADQYFDFVKGPREKTFFGEGIAAHVSTAQPTCAVLTHAIVEAAKKVDIEIHTGKTYGCVDGPRLGTRAESFFLRNSVGCDVVGMTNVPEVFLAKEAQISYATIAIATDYDCWRDDPEQFVTLSLVMERYAESLAKVKKVLQSVMSMSLVDVSTSPSRQSLADAILTPAEAWPVEKKEIIEILQR